MDELGAVGGNIVREPFVEIKVLATGSKRSDVECEIKRTNVEERIENLIMCYMSAKTTDRIA